MPAFTTAMLLLGGVGLGLQAFGQHKAGQAEAAAGAAQRKAAESQAQLAEFNASVADLQAADATARGAQEAAKFRKGVDALIGSQRAGISAGNIDVGFGSAVDVQADAAFLGELDALTIKTNAAREAWGYRVESTDLRKRADIARREGVYLEKAGQQRQSAANWSAAGTIIGGTSSLLEARYGFGRVTKKAA